MTTLMRQLARFRNAESATSLVLTVALVVLATYFTIRSDRFLTVGNLQVIVANYSVIAVATVGMALLMISGPVDLSLGSTVGATGTLMALMVHDHHWPAAVAILTLSARPATTNSMASAGTPAEAGSFRCVGWPATIWNRPGSSTSAKPLRTACAVIGSTPRIASKAASTPEALSNWFAPRSAG